MFNRINQIQNSVWNGLIIGFFVPLVPGSVAWWLIHHHEVLRKADLLLIFCVGLNALLMNYFFKINKDNVARGIISITFLWGFAFFAYKVS